MCSKSVLNEINDMQIAVELIKLGARMQVLETETKLSRRRLLKLYKELKGCSPPKGMLPFSVDWYMSWEQNIHSSIFYNIYNFLLKSEQKPPIEVMIKSYKLYLEHCFAELNSEPVLGLTRAWTLLRFVDCGLIECTKCGSCGGSFITMAENKTDLFTCSLCCTPSRASKKEAIML
ncbi:TPA: flagellar transcriptional regulator FlhC [Salmonella enterica]|uniref:Flagellar transcriptional regulator FlhC n=1 Tax=Salmonella enterica TaxID=28901 RepID=A0A756YKG7_SALER|nr:flagellar transcriptional regulator FlhC [Salmonella enterica subsp. enterica serovar Richmond]HAG0390752.1 flagellar transcriptional regulator FlhC [Salmonella enterica]